MSPTAGDDSESGRDSTSDRPHESLYRRVDGAAEAPSKPTPRHFESSVSRPDEAETGYGWLFRSDPVVPVGVNEADISTAGQSISPVPAGGPFDPVGAATLAGALAPTAVPAAAAPSRPDVASGQPRPDRHRRRWRLWVLILVVVLVAVFGVFRLLGASFNGVLPAANQVTNQPRSDPTKNSPAAAPEATTGVTPYAGSVAVVVQKSVDADCQAPDAQDGGGTRVSYDPGNVGDSDPATAWRCDGAAEGSILTLTLPEDTRIAEVGLINGYAKIDPRSGADRYGEYRRVTRVSWIFDDGTTISQTLTDGLETLQRMRIDPVTSTSVQLRIDSSSDPGSTRKTRDAVLISEASVASPT